VTLEGKLDPAAFVRIHRATLVNLHYVAGWHGFFGGGAALRLTDAGRTELHVARHRVAHLRERLGF
jgi:DNA-binding LytR/AlgR family response regulator